MKRLSLFLLMGAVCLSAQAFGQAARFDSTAQTTELITGRTVLVPAPLASVTVCNYPATVSSGSACTNKASVCPDATLVGCTTGAPNNPIIADARGNFGFWIASGSYDYTICAVSGVCQGPYHVVLGSASGANGAFTVDGTTYTTIQAAITAAGATGYVIIPSNYAGTDTYTNPTNIQINDRRNAGAGPSRYRGFINALTDCGLKGSGLDADATAETAAATACLNAYPSWRILFPPTKSDGSCSYKFNGTLYPTGEGTAIVGGSSGYKNNSTQEGGTVLCWTAGVTGIELDLTGKNCSACTIEDISIMGSEGQGHLQTPTSLNLPANLPQFVRNVSTIQRATNVLTVVTSALAAGGEALTQQVGSTVKISGVVGDSTMNGNCVIATLTGTNTFGENATGFTCNQNGADSGPFGAVGTVGLPSTGASTADGVRICTNFAILKHVTISNFGRHGVNADSLAADAMCPSNFSDDLIIENSTIVGNQANGFYCKGVDCNAGYMHGNPVYYNTLWGVEDQSSLGNTWVGNQISNNGSAWATSAAPSTKAISTISRTLSGGHSTVTVVLSVADTNLKLGSCVVIAGVTDSSFNTTAGQCFFITSYTDSTHFQYEQPGAPSNASSSGGISRMAKFSEVYLTAGVDSGAVKVATQSSTYSQAWFSNYVEGGQDCKFNNIVIVISGANLPTCVSLATWKPASISTNPTNGAQSTNITTFYTGINAGSQLSFIPGKSGSTVRNFLFRWYNNNTSLDAWGLEVNPTGTAGASGSWILGSGTAGSVQRRLAFFGSSSASGLTQLASESTGAVEINNFNGAGSGGVKFGSGGVTNSTVSTIDATGLGTFNGGVKAGASGSTIADTREIFQSVHSCGTTTTCANTANGSNKMVFGSVALSSGTPSTATVSSITAFASTASYFCVATNTTTQANPVKVANVSTTSFTITGPNTVTDVVNYQCVGN